MTTPARKVRCAIYTRKSTEEGLDMEFNSLDAQREACAAYIASQRHEGWIARDGSYDDGGFSGGSMDRPHPWGKARRRHYRCRGGLRAQGPRGDPPRGAHRLSGRLCGAQGTKRSGPWRHQTISQGPRVSDSDSEGRMVRGGDRQNDDRRDRNGRRVSRRGRACLRCVGGRMTCGRRFASGSFG